jgi:hypothetical protein
MVCDFTKTLKVIIYFFKGDFSFNDDTKTQDFSFFNSQYPYCRVNLEFVKVGKLVRLVQVQ